MFRIYASDQLIYEPGDPSLALLNPKLTLEMGKAGSLEFTVPSGHPHISTIRQLTKPVYVKMDDDVIFRGRVLSGTRTFYNQREIYCEGELSYLVDSVQKAVKFDGKTHDLFRQIIANHNSRMPIEKQFVVGNITVENRDIVLTGQSDDDDSSDEFDYRQIAIDSVVDNWNTTYDYIETCLLSYVGGYLMTRRVGPLTYIDWVADYTSTASQQIEFGENMLDLTDETSAEDIFTVLIPLGDDNLTIKTVNNDSDELVDAAGVAKYGRIIKTNVFSNVTDANTLLENGQHYLANNGDVPATITITAVDLHSIYPNIAPIRLGDRVYIRSNPHGISNYLTCSKIEYDLENPANTVYTFGREKQSLTQRYKEDQRNQSDTYGNSSDGSGIGSTAAATGQNWKDITDDYLNKSSEETERQLSDFYDAWINCDDIEGKIDLGAVYKKIVNDETILENNLGIRMDAEQGKINIFADHESITETKDALGTVKTALKNHAGLDVDAPAGTVSIFADHESISTAVTDVNTVKTTLKNHAGIDIDAPAGSINIFADHNRITETQDDIGTVKSVLYQSAGLNIDAPNGTVDIFATASIASEASDKADNAQSTANGADEKAAHILLWAGEDEYGRIGTNIALQADLVTVDNRLIALEGVFESITAERAYISRGLAATSVYAPHYYVNTGNDSTEYDLANHKHSLFCDANGYVTMGAPVAPNVAVGFSIADTQYFKDAVSAAVSASVSSIIANRETTDGNIVWNPISQTLSADYTLVARDVDENVLYRELEYPIILPAAKAYNAGQDYGAGTVEITGASVAISNTHMEENEHHFIVAEITPTARALKSDGTYATAEHETITNRKIAADAVYEAGWNAVEIPLSGIIASKSGTYGTDQDDRHYVTIAVTATASNDATNNRNTTVYVDDVYDGGWNYGANTASIVGASTSVSEMHLEQDGHHYVVITVTPRARTIRSDGSYNIINDDVTGIRISADAVYEAGAASVPSSPSVTSISASRETTDANIVWNAENNTISADYTLIARDINNNILYRELEYPIILPADKAFNAVEIQSVVEAEYGQASYKDVSVSEENVKYSQVSAKSVTGFVTATMSNGKTANLRVTLKAEKAYNAGWDYGISLPQPLLTGIAVTNSHFEDSGHHYIMAEVSTTYRGKNSSGSYVQPSPTKFTRRITADAVYEDGFLAGQASGGSASTIASITSARETTDDNIYWNSNSKTLSADFNLYAKDSSDANLYIEREHTISLPATKAYNAGWDYGTTTMVVETPSFSVSNQHLIQNNSHYVVTTINGVARITKSDGTFLFANKSFTERKVQADTVYQDGYIAGRNASGGSSSVASITSSRETTDANVYWNSDNKTVSADFNLYAKDSSDANLYIEREHTISIPATKAYNAGWDYGISTTNSILVSITVSNSHFVENGHHYINIDAKTTYRSEQSDGTYLQPTPISNIRRIVADDAYTAGFTAGQASGGTSVPVALITSSRNTTDANVYWDSTNKTISADFNLYAKDSSGNNLYVEQDHTITIPATKAYEAGASDVTVDRLTSLSYSTTYDKLIYIGNVLYQSTTKYVFGRAKVLLSNGTETVVLVYMPATDAYSYGQNYGASTVEVTGASTAITNTHLVENGHHYVVTTITPTARATKYDETYATTNKAIDGIKISADAVYNAGLADGGATASVASITSSRQTSDSNVYWNSSNKTVSADFTLIAKDSSNNNLYTARDHTITIPAAKAYNAGWDYGASTAAVKSISTTVSVASYNQSTTKWTASVAIIVETNGTNSSSQLVNGATGSKLESVDVTNVYSSGYKTGQDYGAKTVEVIGSTVYVSNTHLVENGHHYVVVSVKPTAKTKLSDGSDWTTQATFTDKKVSADAVYSSGYSAGVSDGSSASTVDRIAISTLYNSSTKKYGVSATAYNSSGTALVTQSTSTNLDAYDSGYTDGRNSVSVSSAGWEQDEYGATNWNRIWVRLDNGTMVPNVSISPNGYTTGYQAGYHAGQSSSSGTYQEGYNAGYSAGYDNGYSNGWRQGVQDTDRVTSITVTSVTSSAAGIRAYHLHSSYSFKWVNVGDGWNCF